jgi:hypothetical protein
VNITAARNASHDEPDRTFHTESEQKIDFLLRFFFDFFSFPSLRVNVTMSRKPVSKFAGSKQPSEHLTRKSERRALTDTRLAAHAVGAGTGLRIELAFHAFARHEAGELRRRAREKREQNKQRRANHLSGLSLGSPAQRMTDLYALLGVSKSDVDRHDAAWLKKAYLRRAVAVHPDKPGGDTAQFQALQAAYEILAHADKRAAYDRDGWSDELRHDWTDLNAAAGECGDLLVQSPTPPSSPPFKVVSARRNCVPSRPPT